MTGLLMFIAYLINLYEYLASHLYRPENDELLNPNSFDSDGDGIGDYDDRFWLGGLTYGEMFDDGDLLPDIWEAL